MPLPAEELPTGTVGVGAESLQPDGMAFCPRRVQGPMRERIARDHWLGFFGLILNPSVAGRSGCQAGRLRDEAPS